MVNMKLCLLNDRLDAAEAALTKWKDSCVPGMIAPHALDPDTQANTIGWVIASALLGQIKAHRKAMAEKEKRR